MGLKLKCETIMSELSSIQFFSSIANDQMIQILFESTHIKKVVTLN